MTATHQHTAEEATTPTECCGPELITEFDIEEIADYLHDKMRLTSLDCSFNWNDTNATVSLTGKFPVKVGAASSKGLPADLADEEDRPDETTLKELVRLRDEAIAAEAEDFAKALRALADTVTPDSFCDLYADLCHLFEFVYCEDFTTEDLIGYDPATAFPSTSDYARAFSDIVSNCSDTSVMYHPIGLILRAKRTTRFRRSCRPPTTLQLGRASRRDRSLAAPGKSLEELRGFCSASR